jgi:hypothetical protein
MQQLTITAAVPPHRYPLRAVSDFLPQSSKSTPLSTDLAVFQFSRYNFCTEPQRTPLSKDRPLLYDVTSLATPKRPLLCRNLVTDALD